MNAIYTKKIFTGALYELLKEKSLDNIRVSEICAHCGLSKKAFYYHFTDKYELGAALYEELAKRSLPDMDVENYMSRLASGDPDLNQITQKSIDLMQREMYAHVHTHTSVSRGLLRSKSCYNAVTLHKYRAMAEGKKSIMLKRAKEKGIHMSNELLEAGASCLVELFDYYSFERWSGLNDMPIDEAERLVKLTNDMIDFFVDHGEK